LGGRRAARLIAKESGTDQKITGARADCRSAANAENMLREMPGCLVQSTHLEHLGLAAPRVTETIESFCVFEHDASPISV
jgi:hypothetical protein